MRRPRAVPGCPAGRWAGHRAQFGCWASGSAGHFNDADVRSNDAPALRKPDPGLHLAAHLAGRTWAMKQRRGHRKVTAVGGDQRPATSAVEPDWGAPGTKCGDLLVAVKVLPDAIADGALVLVEQGIERVHVVGDERLLVALKRLAHLGNDLG